MCYRLETNTERLSGERATLLHSEFFSVIIQFMLWVDRINKKKWGYFGDTKSNKVASVPT